ncbi:MAG: transcription-repair coupling factor [Deltaproteobacteria bacterium]|nr:transcription-repair coupling factor [Deltaproteobacteria bacterium]
MPDNDTTQRLAFEKAVEGGASLAPGHRCVFSGVTGASKAFFVASIYGKKKASIIVILPTEAGAERFYSDSQFFLGPENVFFYPSTELLPFETDDAHPEIVAKREAFISAIKAATACGSRVFAVTSVDNMAELVFDDAGQLPLALEKGKEYKREDLIDKLLSLGYEKMQMAEELGEMSVRGSIIDVYARPSAETGNYPVRLEFFGDELESLRTFDPLTQRSVRILDKAVITAVSGVELSQAARSAAREKLLDRASETGADRSTWGRFYDMLANRAEVKGLSILRPFFGNKKGRTLLELFSKDNLTVVVCEALETESSIDSLYSDIEAFAPKVPFINPADLYARREELESALSNMPVVELDTLAQRGATVDVSTNLKLRQDIALKKDLTPLRAELRSMLNDGVTVVLTAHNKGQAERMSEIFLDEGAGSGLRVLVGEGFAAAPMPGAVNIRIGSLSAGFRIRGLAVITEEEIFGERIDRRPPKKKKAEELFFDLSDLKEGDHIVHFAHGVGIYKGLERIAADGVEADFLRLEYKDGDRLYVPVSALDQISRYGALEGRAIELDKLGAKTWNKKKARAKKEAERVAGELIKLYAERKAAKGHQFSVPGHMFNEFEAAFEYDETPDQRRAIDDVMKDMGSSSPMDRLVCGDVGYGKTEVAMRAAFRALIDSKQVAVLVPTTILAEQHFRTFRKRFASFPATIEVLSRFRSVAEQREALKKLAAGNIDVIIGTHRLFQKDVIFKDLGLMVIDEEHRFGVRHKERLKEIRRSVDVLTLSATPIPRTLHMAVGGVRDLSIMSTAPEGRLAVTTRVVRDDDEIIRQAIEREIRRDGQIFFVHNRVEGIGAVKARIEEITASITPKVRVGVAHGQMDERELERIMLAFINREYDVLLSTTIIESGLDIPSANTIIVNRADRFGLAELYQLRGRVGRSSHRAYAYFICPDKVSMTADAVKRMEVMGELSEIGSGFRVAAYDLEIRGAGEMLGTAQSGNITEVGFDMYAELLNEAVAELKGEAAEETQRVEVKLKVSQYLPDEYVPDARDRLIFYKRVAMSESDDELFDFMAEAEDRYGKLPALATNLFETKRIELLLRDLHATELAERGGRLYVSFRPDVAEKAPALIDRIMRLARDNKDRFRLMPDSRLVYVMEQGRDSVDQARYMLKELGG